MLQSSELKLYFFFWVGRAVLVNMIFRTEDLPLFAILIIVIRTWLKPLLLKGDYSHEPLQFLSSSDS
jgi:hypothetical protein